MIQNKETFTIETEGGMSSTEFKLREEDKAHIFNVLRNNLYSDKMLAVIREYSTNAWDANMCNKKGNVPIQVTLPNAVDQVFKVRDFGTGLSEDEVYNIYASYGLSTKRSTNKLVGTLGFGSKSGFAYVDNFTITSWHGGKKSVYEAFIDPTNIGKIVKLHEEPSDEPTGLCITIAVDSKDINQFTQTATNFYAHFNPMPQFFGVDISTRIENMFSLHQSIHESKHGKFLTAKSWSAQTGVHVVMGNICYPFPSEKIDWFPRSGYYLLVLNMNIGDIKFTTSRESIELDDDTVSTIVKKAEEFQKEILAGIQSKIDSKETAAEAIELYWTLDRYSIKLIDQIGFTYRGQSMDVKFIEHWGFKRYNDVKDVLSKFEHATLELYKKSTPAILINDGNFPASELRARIIKASGENKNSLFLNCNIAESKTFMDLPEAQGMNFVYLSEVMGLPPKRSSKSNFSKNENIFLWNGTTCPPYSKCWEIAPEVSTTDEKVYVEINAYLPRLYSSKPMQKLSKLVKVMKIDKIYGVKSKYVKNLDSTWIDLDTYINRQVQKMINANFKKLYVSSAMIDSYGYDNLTSRMQRLFPSQNSNCDIVNRLLAKIDHHRKIVDSASELNKANSEMLSNITAVYSLSSNANSQYEALKAEVKKEKELIQAHLITIETSYPLLKYVSHWSYNSLIDDHFAIYINAVAQDTNAKAKFENGNLNKDGQCVTA